MSLQRNNGGTGPPTGGMELVNRFIDRAEEARKMAEKTKDHDHRAAAYSVMRRYIEMAVDELDRIRRIEVIWTAIIAGDLLFKEFAIL